MIGKDSNVALGRSTVSKLLTHMCNALESTPCPKWIKFGRSSDNFLQWKSTFIKNSNSIIGCFDGIYVKIKAPIKDSHFLQQKGLLQFKHNDCKYFQIYEYVRKTKKCYV